MKSNKLNRWSIIPFILFITFLVTAGINSRIHLNSLRNNGVIVPAKITACKDPGWRTAGIEFHFGFVVNGRTINDEMTESNILTRNGKYFIGKNFPLIYDSTNTKNNRLLIVPETFKIYDLPFPDSLNWVTQYE